MKTKVEGSIPNCPVTNKPFVCSECIMPDLFSKDGRCPIMKYDDLNEEVIEFMRKVVENEKRNK